MGISTKDRQRMHRALDLAAQGRGRTSPNPMVGAVVVKDEETVGEGWHAAAGRPHAEVEALKDAGEHARGATLYVNLEPCCHKGRTPPCTDAIIEAGIVRVVAATLDPNPLVSGSGLRRLRAAGVEVDCGVLEGEARRLNESFITFHVKKRPFTIMKWAMTLDGRTSTSTGDSRWISNDESREYVHQIRAQVDAIAVGVGTVIYDNPRLNVRLKDYEGRQPVRVVLDGRLRVPTEAKCLTAEEGGRSVILTTSFAAEDRVKRLRDAGHKVIVLPAERRIVDIEAALKALAEEEGVQSLLVEGGREIHSSLLRAHMADKAVIFTSPKIVGGGSLEPPVHDLGIARMRDAMALRNVSIRTFGTDACIEGYLNPVPSPPETIGY